MPAPKEILAIVDNYATHKQPKVRQWFARHPGWTFHFTPTSASWLNAVEAFFANLTKRRLKRGTFLSVVDYKQQSIASSPNTMLNRNPSHGPLIPTKSTKPSDAGT